MKKLLLLLSFLTMPLSFAGDEVNNGGGIAEANFANAYVNLEQYIDYCVELPSCGVTESEKELLVKIQESLEIEYRNTKQLVFLSESKNPGTFIINGELKVAKTGDQIGSPIMINTDLIYFQRKPGKQKIPLSIAQATAILVHEMGHHHGVEDHAMLDLLGAKVSMALQPNITETKLLPNSEGIKAVVINGQTETEFPKIIFNVFGQSIDATEAFKKKLSCKIIGLPLPVNLPTDIAISFKKPLGATFHNTHWHKNKFKRKRGKIVLRGNLTKYCKKSLDLFYNNKKYKALITLRFEKYTDKNGKDSWKYKEDSLKIKEDYDPWWKIIRIPFPTFW